MNTVFRSLLLSVGLVVLAIGSYVLFDNITNVHFKGSIGIADWPVYVFLKKQVDPVLATYKGLPIDFSSAGYSVDEATYKRLPEATTFFSKIPIKMAIVQGKTGPMSGGFNLSIPRKNLPKDDSLVFVADKHPKLWYRIVGIPEGIQFQAIDLDSAAIVSNTGRYSVSVLEPMGENSRKR